MIDNFMMLNEDKTEFLLLGSKKSSVLETTLSLDGVLIENMRWEKGVGKSLGVMPSRLREYVERVPGNCQICTSSDVI